ncbi:hypothetical protein ACHAQJ_005428 [Trichoderma viride]
MATHPNWSVRFTEPITKLPPLFPRSIPLISRRTMAHDMDLEQLFTETSESAGTFIEPDILGADTASADASAAQDGTSSRRLRPRRAKTTTAPDTITPTQSARSNRSTARSRTSKKSSRAASKKKAARREAALAATQAATQSEQEPVTGTPATAASSPSQAEGNNYQFTL